jgi:hypothetical protein
MPCVILQDVEGKRRLVQIGVPYRRLPGEIRVGVDRTCGAIKSEPVQVQSTARVLLNELDQELGKGGIGDWFKILAKPVAKIVGKAQCSSCETRRVVANAYAALKAKHGQIEALRIIKDLVKASFSENDEEVLAKLKEFLT